jgi:hypothetical protein
LPPDVETLFYREAFSVFVLSRMSSPNTGPPPSPSGARRTRLGHKGVDMFLLRILNPILLLSFVGCLAGAMAGLIVFAPFVGGAWLLTIIAIVGSEPTSPTPSRPPHSRR